MIVGCLLANMQEILPGTRKSLEMAGRTGYLALTGERVRHGDAVASGLATHAMKAADKDMLAEELARTGDPDAALRSLPRGTRSFLGQTIRR